MNKTLRLSFALKITYRVNSILYALKQIPLLKKLLPAALYRVRGLKIFASVLAILWEILSVFLGKALYFLTMVCGIGALYEQAPAGDAFLHILLFLTAAGAFLNTGMFNPTRDKYYAMILLRMDAREYTLVNYGYTIFKVVVGFLPFTILFGLSRDVPLIICLLLPLSVAGAKLTVAAISLWDYERRGVAYNENALGKHLWLLAAALLALAYGLPALDMALPSIASVAVFGIFVLTGLLSIPRILRFSHYRAVQQELLTKMLSQVDSAKLAAKTTSEKAISADTSIGSRRHGFEYLNELFIKRHQKILWKATKKITLGCLILTAGAAIAMILFPEARAPINRLFLGFVPYFAFIMYAINRGTSFTQALFMNCDHSLLTYSFYKQPRNILRLFRIRLREITKINAVPGAVLGAGLCLLLYVSGGTDHPLNYLVLFVTILSMSVFFSIHYLTIYYLLQPYNAGTEIKSGTYQLIMFLTYLVCYALMQIRLPLLAFGIGCIAFCVLYSAVASILVYRLAPKTFRIRP